MLSFFLMVIFKECFCVLPYVNRYSGFIFFHRFNHKDLCLFTKFVEKVKIRWNKSKVTKMSGV